MISKPQTLPKTLLEAYNEGIGDGLVYATAVMGSASNEMLNELREEVKAKRRAIEGDGRG